MTPEEVDTFARSFAGSLTTPPVRADERTVVERQSPEVRSIDEVIGTGLHAGRLTAG